MGSRKIAQCADGEAAIDVNRRENALPTPNLSAPHP